MNEFDCNGQCGAVEEHVMEYDWGDTICLSICHGEVTSLGHHPLIAGHTVAGKPLYFNGNWPTMAFPDGLQIGKEYSVAKHYTNGSTELTSMSFPVAHISVLRYEPHVYEMNERYGSRGKKVSGMDAAGPILWHFHKKLPSNQPSTSTPKFPGDLPWVEILLEHEEKEILAKSSDYPCAQFEEKAVDRIEDDDWSLLDLL